MKRIDGRAMAGRTVVVTGATSGMGRATALGLARMGAHVAIAGRDGARTHDVAGEIAAALGGGRIEALLRICPPRCRCGGWPARASMSLRGSTCS